MDEYGRHRLGSKGVDRPIFVFSPSERCGSTLLQRFLSSHPDVLIWGEQRGALCRLQQFYSVSMSHSIDYTEVSDVYVASGVQSFIANLAPTPSSIRNATTSAIRNMYGGFAERWGCKEIRCDANVAVMLLDLFPEVRIVFLVRHLGACISSLMRWEYDTEQLLEVAERWITMIDGVGLQNFGSDPRVMFIRFEEFLSTFESHTSRLGTFLELDHRDFDEEVLRLRVADFGSVVALTAPRPRAMCRLDEALIKTLIGMGAQAALVSVGYKEF